ncbi:secreted ookinete protein, putative [Plasmodium vivax]|nr:secreted ookinete protein, putative [Plasmodium vivax]
MYKRTLFVLGLALLNFLGAESKNVVSSFLSYLNSKINSTSEISKVVQMGDTMTCLVSKENNNTRNECSCSFKKLKEFEKKCSSNFKKNQEDAKNCSEEHCEICCSLMNSNSVANSILDYEFFCKKKCARSSIVSNLNEDDYKLVFKKLIEFIRIFYPSNVLNYYPIRKRASANYTNRPLDAKNQTIMDDLSEEPRASNREHVEDRTTSLTAEESEEFFSSYDES